MNSVETLLAALKREQRRPVDLNLGQVPITPTIGRMGNYNVVTRAVVRDNTASELSRALSQLPQLIGQARNISEASGRAQAEELSLDEINERWKNGDTEAEGFMTWLGSNKAFEEAAYQRIFDADIKPRLTKVSSDIDNMSIAELSQLKSDEDIAEFVQGNLVSGLDPEILETIQKSPFQAIRHNRALEAIIPEYTQRAAANITARKKAFQKEEAKRGVASNVFTGLDVSLQDTKEKDYINNIQATISFAQARATDQGLNKFEFEDALMPVLSAQLDDLIQDERFEEVDVILEQLEEGKVTVNGRPLNQNLKGMEMITRAEKSLEFAEERAADVKVDQQALDEFELPLLDQNSEFFRAGDFSDESVTERLDALNTLRAELDERTDVNDATLRKMYSIIDLQKDSVRGEARVYAEFSESMDRKKNAEFVKASGLDSQRLLESLENLTTFREVAETQGVGTQFESLIVPEVDRDRLPTGKEQLSDPMIAVFSETAVREAKQEVLGGYMNTKEYKELLQPQPTEELQQQQAEFFAEVSDMFQTKYKEKFGASLKAYLEEQRRSNPVKTQEDKQRTQKAAQERDMFLKQAREGGSSFNEKGELVKDVVGTEVGPSSFQGVAGERTDIMGWNFTKGVSDLANPEARRLLKDTPVTKKIDFATGLQNAAANYTRRTEVGQQIDETNAKLSEELLKVEIEKVRHTGLPLSDLLRSEGAALAKGEYRTGFLGYKLRPWRIRYDAYGNYTNPVETTQRIYNVKAILEYVRNGDRTTLDRIQQRLLPSMSPEVFAKNQAKLLEQIYGSMTEDEAEPQPQQTNE